MKADVKKTARHLHEKVSALVSNKEEYFVPALTKALIHPIDDVPDTTTLLSATTFASEVDSPTCSLVASLLSPGPNGKLTATKHKVVVIIDNMAKLVDSPVTVRLFISKLLPGLIQIEGVTGDPEACSFIAHAIATLRQVGEVPTSDGSDLPPLMKAEEKTLVRSLIDLYKKAGAKPVPSVADVATIYASRLAANMVNQKNFEVSECQTLIPYLSEEECEDLCNCRFSLAYGVKILLNIVTLRLKWGHRYGLCGSNGTRTSTLMGAITSGYFALTVSVAEYDAD